MTQAKGWKAAHGKWPLCVLGENSEIISQLLLINIEEGRVAQILELEGDLPLRSVCWHEELLVLGLGFDDRIEIWVLDDDIRYIELLDEGLVSPNFDTLSSDEYYSVFSRFSGVSGKEDVLGSNQKRRLEILWRNRYGNIRLRRFASIDLSKVNGEKTSLKKLNWLDHDKLVVLHLDETQGTYLTLWKLNFGVFDIDIYQEIKKRRRFEKTSNLLFSELEKTWIEVLIGIEAGPILQQEIDLPGGSGDDLRVIFDHSERFMLVYQYLKSEVFIWRYEGESSEKLGGKDDFSGASDGTIGTFPSQFQLQKITLNEGERIVGSDWKPCCTGIPYGIKRRGGISEISVFSIISRTKDEILVRIWRESSLNKPCIFFQSLLLKFNNRPLLKNEEIELIWEDSRENLTSKCKIIEAEIKDQSYYYSTNRFPLTDESQDDFFYFDSSLYTLEKARLDEESPKFSLPLNSCIHSEDIFLLNEKQEKLQRLVVLLGREIFGFNVSQLDVWNDEVSPSVSKLNLKSPAQNSLVGEKNRIPSKVSQTLFFWKAHKLSSHDPRDTLNFIFKLKDSSIVEYLYSTSGTWELSKLIPMPCPNPLKTIPSHPNASSHAISAFRLSDNQDFLLLLNNGNLMLLRNLSPVKAFTHIHVNYSTYDHKCICSCGKYVENGTEKNSVELKEEIFGSADIGIGGGELLDLGELEVIKAIGYLEWSALVDYQLLLVLRRNERNLSVFGLNGFGTSGNAILELLEVEIVGRFANGEDFESFDSSIERKAEILEILFGDLTNEEYRVVFLEKYVSLEMDERRTTDCACTSTCTSAFVCVCICVVEDLNMGVNHLIMFEINSICKNYLLMSIENGKRVRVELRVISSLEKSLEEDHGQHRVAPSRMLSTKSCFKMINLRQVRHPLMFVASEICRKEGSLDIGEFQQFYIYVYKVSQKTSGEGGISLVCKIKLNKAFFGNDTAGSLLMDALDYNILILNKRTGLILCYSLLSLNMLGFDEEDCTLSLTPFQEIRLEVIEPKLEAGKFFKNGDGKEFKDVQLVLLQDFDLTYYCLIFCDGEISITLNWNREICKWNIVVNREMDFSHNFQGMDKSTKILGLQGFDGLFMLFSNDKLLPRIYKRPERQVYEEKNNFSLSDIRVLEDFVFSLNDRKQSFSREIFEKISESQQEAPNLNIRPYNIASEMSVPGRLNSESLLFSDEKYANLYDSFASLYLENKEKSKMSIMELEEYNIERYFIRKAYFGNKNPDFVLKSEDICWILLAEKDRIIDRILEKDGGGEFLGWKELRSYGVVYILTDNSKFREFIEQWVQKLYQRLVRVVLERKKETRFEFAGDQTRTSGQTEGGDVKYDEILNIILVVYTCLNKLNIVSAIFNKILDQKNVFDFLLNYSTNNDDLRRQAMKNGYYLIKQRKFHWSLCFFILSKSFDEIANVCLKFLKDPQLLILLLKLLINLNGDQKDSPESQVLFKIYNKYLADIWQLSLLNKDPWLSMIALVNYSAANNNSKLECISNLKLYNSLLNLSLPTNFFPLCNDTVSIEAFLLNHSNKYCEEDFCDSKKDPGVMEVFEASPNLNGLFDLSFSFIHPEHLILFRNYIQYKLSINSQSPSTLGSGLSKVPSFEDIIEIMSYYIKKCMNPYHYFSWLSHIEENKNVYNSCQSISVYCNCRNGMEARDYFNFYELIIKPNIFEKILSYAAYLHSNYYLLADPGNDQLFQWAEKLCTLSPLAKNSSGARTQIFKLTYNPFNSLAFKIEDFFSRYKNDAIKKLLHANVMQILFLHVDNKISASDKIQRYKKLILLFSEDAKLEEAIELVCFLSCLNVDLALLKLDSGRRAQQGGGQRDLRIFVLLHRIFPAVGELLSGRTGVQEDEFCELRSRFVNLVKVYIIMEIVDKIKVECRLDSELRFYGKLEELFKFVTMLVVFQGLELHLKNRLDSGLTLRLLSLMELFFEFGEDYGHCIGLLEDDQQPQEPPESSEGAMYFSSVLLVLSSGFVKTSQNLIKEGGDFTLKFKLGNAHASSRAKGVFRGFGLNMFVGILNLLELNYNLRLFIVWRELLLSLLPLIMAYFQMRSQIAVDFERADKVTARGNKTPPASSPSSPIPPQTASHQSFNPVSLVLFVRVEKNLQKLCEEIARTGEGEDCLRELRLLVLLRRIWVGMEIGDFLLLNVLRNREIISLYGSNSVSNLYGFIRAGLFPGDAKGSSLDNVAGGGGVNPIHLESNERFSVDLWRNPARIEKQTLNLNFSFYQDVDKFPGFGLSKAYRSQSQNTNSVVMSSDSSPPDTPLLNMLVYTHRIVPTPKLTMTIAATGGNSGAVVVAGGRREGIAKPGDSEPTHDSHSKIKASVRAILERFYAEDDYFAWYRDLERRSKEKKEELFLGSLLLQESPLVMECGADQNYPFLIESQMNHLLLNSKLYYIHPVSFLRRNSDCSFGSSCEYEKYLFRDEGSAGKSKFSVLNVRLEFLLNAVLLRRLLTFGWIEKHSAGFGLLSYKRLSGLNRKVESIIRNRLHFRENKYLDVDFCVNVKKGIRSLYLELYSPKDGLETETETETEAQAQVEAQAETQGARETHEDRKPQEAHQDQKPQEAHQDQKPQETREDRQLRETQEARETQEDRQLPKPRETQKPRGQTDEERTRTEKRALGRGKRRVFSQGLEVRFLQIYTDVPLSFSKIRGHFNNIKAIICGETVQLRNPKVCQIIYPYWSHSLPFSNYHRICSPNNFGGEFGPSSVPKPVIISNNVSKLYGTHLGLRNTSQPWHNNNLYTGKIATNGEDCSEDLGRSSTAGGNVAKNQSQNHNLGNVTHVSWSQSKVHLVLSTSNGFVLVYKLNPNFECPKGGSNGSRNGGKGNSNGSNSAGSLQDEDEMFLSAFAPKGSKDDDPRHHYSPSSDKRAANPFIPVYIYQVHRSSCTWSRIIDHSCRYVITLGGGIGMSLSGVGGGGKEEPPQSGPAVSSSALHSSSSLLSTSNFVINRSGASRGSIAGSGTLNLAEFMGDNTLNLSSRTDISASLLANENYGCPGAEQWPAPAPPAAGPADRFGGGLLVADLPQLEAGRPNGTFGKRHGKPLADLPRFRKATPRSVLLGPSLAPGDFESQIHRDILGRSLRRPLHILSGLPGRPGARLDPPDPQAKRGPLGLHHEQPPEPNQPKPLLRPVPQEHLPRHLRRPQHADRPRLRPELQGPPAAPLLQVERGGAQEENRGSRHTRGPEGTPPGLRQTHTHTHTPCQTLQKLSTLPSPYTSSNQPQLPS
ncbi:Rne/Rng family ribonuclease [Cryptosporidium felis]|nr:Rne/Rng family ribonuclease [Cryptosporidium felis]